MDAGDFVASLDLRSGFSSVLWHSAMWVYLPPEARGRVLEGARRLGALAGPDRPFAHVSWEWDPAATDPARPFALVMRVWSGMAQDGRPRLVARGMSHGLPAALSAPQVLDRDPLALS